MNNLLSDLPEDLGQEAIETLFEHAGVRVERIVSCGHTSPETGWYDQTEDEWVLVLQGAGAIRFPDGGEIRLQPGDHLYLPAHQRHQVSWTDPTRTTIWLALFLPINDRVLTET